MKVWEGDRSVLFRECFHRGQAGVWEAGYQRGEELEQGGTELGLEVRRQSHCDHDDDDGGNCQDTEETLLFSMLFGPELFRLPSLSLPVWPSES